MLICARCHKSMEMEEGAVGSNVNISSMVGVHYTLTIADGSTAQQEAFLRKQWGKYAPPEGEKTRTIRFCYECWIDSLMGIKGKVEKA